MKYTGPLLALLAVLEAVYLLLTLRGLGFPDGHFTELARLQKTLYPILATLLGGFALGAFMARRRKNTLLVAFIALHAGWIALELWSRSVYDNGTGG